MKTGRDREAGEEIAKCGSFKRAGSEEEMTNEFFSSYRYVRITRTRTQNVRDVSETSEQPSKQKFELGRKKGLTSAYELGS